MEHRERLIGIDLLRLLSMLGIVVLHVLYHGGVLEHTDWMSGQYLSTWFLEICVYCSVNCFALISGFVGVNISFKWSRVINIWLQTIFYSVLFTVIFYIFNSSLISIKMLLKSMFPVFTEQYWYISSYIGMTIFIPLINILYKNIDLRVIEFFIVLIFAICAIACVLQNSPLGLKDGYSTLWLIILYIIGAYLRKSEIINKISSKLLFIILVSSILLTFFCKVFIELVTHRLIGTVFLGNIFINYTSPTILLNAICILCLFVKLKFSSSIVKRIVGILTPVCLGVYLIHDNYYVENYIIKGCVENLVTFNPVVLILIVLGIAVIIFVICALVDLLRNFVFNICKINTICEKFNLKYKEEENEKQI